MPETITREEFEFLREVDRLGAEGLPLLEIARLKGVAAGTITYRINRWGLKAASTTRVVDRRTGRTLQQLVEAGEIVVAESVAPAAEEAVPA